MNNRKRNPSIWIFVRKAASAIVFVFVGASIQATTSTKTTLGTAKKANRHKMLKHLLT